MDVKTNGEKNGSTNGATKHATNGGVTNGGEDHHHIQKILSKGASGFHEDGEDDEGRGSSKLGLLACVIGLVAAVPVVFCITGAAYRQLFSADDNAGFLKGD